MAGDRQTKNEQAGGISWLRVLLIGLAAEMALMVVATPFAFIEGGQDVIMYAVVPATLLLFILFGYWAASPVRDRFVLHGLLTGSVGVILYIVLIVGATSFPDAPPMDWAKSFSPAYLLTHGLKLVGGTIGGWLVARKKAAI